MAMLRFSSTYRLFASRFESSSFFRIANFSKPLPSLGSVTILRSNLVSTSRRTPTAYEADKDYWSLKTTIDDIRAKYGLDGGSHIKDPNLDQHSDLELEVDLTAADVKKLALIQKLLENAAKDMERLISSSAMGPDGKPKKQVWLAEDDDVSGNVNAAVDRFRESSVAGNVDLHAYDLEEGKEEKPAGFQDIFGKK